MYVFVRISDACTFTIKKTLSELTYGLGIIMIDT
jgi:hypothetical protein